MHKPRASTAGHALQRLADTYCRRASLVLSECTCERNPELIQLVLARLADMVDVCCASCMEPDNASLYSVCSTAQHSILSITRFTSSVASASVLDVCLQQASKICHRCFWSAD